MDFFHSFLYFSVYKFRTQIFNFDQDIDILRLFEQKMRKYKTNEKDKYTFESK